MKNFPLYEVRKITSIKDMFKGSVEMFGDKDAFMEKKQRGGEYVGITYKQAYKDMTAFGTALLDMGLADKKVAIIGNASYKWAITYLSTVNGKSIVVPIDKELPAEDIENLLNMSGASCVVYIGKFSDAMKDIKTRNENLEYLINMDLEASTDDEKSWTDVLAEGQKLVDEGSTEFENVVIDVDKMQILLFTSGTTSAAKGVMLSHKNIATDLMAMCSMFYIDKSDIFLSVLPIHHTYECTCGFLCPLYRGCTIAYAEGLKYIQKNLQESHASILLGVPALYETFYKRIWAAAKKSGQEPKLKKGLAISNALRKVGIDVRRKIFKSVLDNFGGNLKAFISGAAAINPEVSKGFRDLGIHFIQGYGITECSPIVSLNRDKYYKDDSIGLPLPCLEVDVIDKDSEGIGEIVCKGDSVMLGYYNNEEASKEAFEGGWFHTGDLGYFDEDGFLYITGRKKSVIVTKNGKNIYPEELESLIDNNPYVLESLVYGEDDDESGETILCALVVPNFEYIASVHGDDFSKDDIKAKIEEAVKEVNTRNPLYKYIRKFEVRETEFAKTTTKKIKRFVEIPKK